MILFRFCVSTSVNWLNFLNENQIRLLMNSMAFLNVSLAIFFVHSGYGLPVSIFILTRWTIILETRAGSKVVNTLHTIKSGNKEARFIYLSLTVY